MGIKGNGILTTKGDRVIIEHKAIGLESKAPYFNVISDRLSNWMSTANTIGEENRNADAVAATVWLRRGQRGMYTSFLSTVVNKYRRKKEECNKKVYAGALKAQREAYTATDELHPMPAAGVAGAKDVIKNQEKSKDCVMPD